MSPEKEVALIAYGSLMSGYGLKPLGRLRARTAARVALLNARRGFAKYSQRGDRYALALEPIDAAAPIGARRLEAHEPASAEPEALLLRLSSRDLDRVTTREGYDPAALGRLRDEAARQACSLAQLLWTLLEGADFDIARYRSRLLELTGYTSPHYIPHPVALGDERALTFLAPGREGSGSARVVPVRVRTGDPAPMTALQAWRERPNPTQLEYFVACFLGALHGICQHDLIGDLPNDSDLCIHVRAALARERDAEPGRFLAATSLHSDAYNEAFGAPAALVARSRLSYLFDDGESGD